MDGDLFQKWFTEALLPNLPDDSVIVMDNASYHNILTECSAPTPACSKEKIRDWLDANKIDNLRIQLDAAFEKVTANTCKKIIEKIRSIEDRFWQEDAEIDKKQENPLV